MIVACNTETVGGKVQAQSLQYPRTRSSQQATVRVEFQHQSDCMLDWRTRNLVQPSATTAQQPDGPALPLRVRSSCKRPCHQTPDFTLVRLVASLQSSIREAGYASRYPLTIRGCTRWLCHPRLLHTIAHWNHYPIPAPLL